MIRVSDAALLAYTKLKTRRIRLLITIFISGLLFSVLAASSFFFRGVIHGVEDFSNEGFGSRYIISGNYQGGGVYGLMQDKATIDKAIAQNKDLINRKKAEAKRLGIDYDGTSDPLPYSEYDSPTGKQRSLDINNPIARNLLLQYMDEHPDPGLPELKKMAESYGATAYYQSEVMPFATSQYRTQVMKDGKEDFKQNLGTEGPQQQTGTDSFSTGWQLMSADLLKPFALPNTSLIVDETGALPIVAPYTAVEQLLGMKALPGSAPTDKKLERLKEVRAKASNLKFSVCYRNSTSAAAVDQALQIQQEILSNKNKKDYQKPSLITDTPDKPCGDVRTTRDVRTADEKTLAGKQEQFRRTFGEPVPESQIVNFRVVGVAPDPPNFAASGVTQLFESILTSNVGQGWFTPSELKATTPILQKVFIKDPMSAGSSSVYAEFPSDQQANKFLDQQNCQPDFSSMPGTGSVDTKFDPFTACAKAGKPFVLNSFGSSSLAIASIKKGFNKFFRIAALVVSIIAAIIMMGTLGRIIADSRRETAVFRAIGAKKLDIAQIYLTYVVMLSTLVAALSILVGFVLSSIADARWSPDLTVKALVAYNAQDLDKQLHLYGFELRDMIYLVLLTFAAGLVSAILPLVSNLRRNPIKDMRDEN